MNEIKLQYARNKWLPAVMWMLHLQLIGGLISCSSSNKISSTDSRKINYPTEKHIAFPGAEGYGKYTIGGRGGKVLVVANLNDNGPGSFRAAAESDFPRIIVFSISGTIHLGKKLIIKSNATIVGQTAPGDGICLADNSVSLGGDNIIVRYLRFRMGDRYQKGGMVDGNGGDDAFGGTRKKNILIDHCSFSWSTDEVFSIYAGDSTTVQWNMIYEPLNYSYHFETGDTGYENHGFGGIWGGVHATFHHNLFAHCSSRTPRFNGIRHTTEENCDFRNNVIYNWGHNNVYAGEGGHYNVVNNYYKPGPSTSKQVINRLVNPFRNEKIPFGIWYLHGNVMEGNQSVTENNKLGFQVNDQEKYPNENAWSDFELKTEPIQTEETFVAYLHVLQYAGCSMPARDTLDERIVEEVKSGRGHIIDVQGGFPHGTEYSKTTGAWPQLKSGTPPLDTDQDGMPDDWEISHGLNPNDPADASKIVGKNRYTNIEEFVNQVKSKN